MPLEDLRPTQVAVGMQAVKCQRRKLEKRASKQRQLKDILERRSIPAVRGPGGDLYMIDRHHFALALW
ncbi:ParB-like protein, partial [Acinetobacter baumannii]